MKASIAALGLAAACLPHAASAATFVANFVAVDGFEERCSARNVCTYIFAPNGSFTLSGTSQGQNFVDASGGRFSIRSEPVFRLDYLAPIAIRQLRSSSRLSPVVAMISNTATINWVVTRINISIVLTSASLDGAPFAINVPEPSTWALLILGFGAVGTGLRRRRESDAPTTRNALHI